MSLLPSQITAAQYEELTRCAESPLHFLVNHFMVIAPDGKPMPFVATEEVKSMLFDYSRYRMNCVATSRQVGKTTLLAGYVLWKALFSKYSTTLVLLDSLNACKHFSQIINDAYDLLPDFMRSTRRPSRSFNFVESNSKIIVQTINPTAGRGLTFDLLVTDDISHNRQDIFANLWTNISPVVMSAKSQVIHTATPVSEGLFATLWHGGKLDPENGVGFNGFHSSLIIKHNDEYKQYLAPEMYDREVSLESFSAPREL